MGFVLCVIEVCVVQWYTQPNQANWITTHAIATECKYHFTSTQWGLCCVWLRCVWSSGTHSQTRRTGSPHTQSLQSVSTTLHLRNGFVLCVVQWYTQPNQANWITTYAIATECEYHSTPTQWGLCCVWLRCVWSSGTHSQTRRTGSPHTQSLQSVSTTLHLRNGFVLCVVQWYTQPNQANWVTAHAIATECEYHSTPTQWGLCCVWLRGVWSSGTHSQTRRTGSPHMQSLQSVSTTLHLRNGVCVVCDWGVCGPVVHTPTVCGQWLADPCQWDKGWWWWSVR